MPSRHALLLAIACCAVGANLPAQDQLKVQVLDHRGRPAAKVPLSLGNLTPFAKQQSWSDNGRVRVWTDAQGWATLPVGSTPRSNLHVQADVVSEPPVRLAVPTKIDKPLTLQLPEMGQIRVIVYDQREKPLEGVSRVELTVPGSARFFDRVRARGEAEGEGAFFRWVGLGQTIHATAQVRGMTGKLERTAAGPTRASELVVLDLRVKADQIARTRLVDAKGQPIGSRHVAVIFENSQACDVSRAKTQADGRLEVRIPKRFAKEGSEGRIHLRLEQEGHSSIVPLEPWNGVRDFGDLRTDAAPIVARGRVVDEAGKPVPGVPLRSRVSWGLRSKYTSIRHDVGNHRVVSDAEGRFVMRERHPRVVAFAPRVADKAPWHLIGATKMVQGRETTLTVVRGVDFTLRLPGIPGDTDCKCVGAVSQAELAKPRRGMGSAPAMISPEVTEQGLLFRNLKPGTWVLQARANNFVFGKTIGLPFEVSATNSKADFAADWNQWLQLVEVTVEGPQGTQVKKDLVAYEVSPGGFSGRGFETKAQGPQRILLMKGERIVAMPRGELCTEEIRQPGPRETLRLRRRPKVRLALPEGVALPRGTRIQIQSEALAWLKTPGVELSVHAETEWLVRPDQFGSMTLTISRPGKKGGFQQVWSTRFQAKQTDEEQRIVLDLDRGDIDELFPVDKNG